MSLLVKLDRALSRQWIRSHPCELGSLYRRVTSSNASRPSKAASKKVTKILYEDLLRRNSESRGQPNPLPPWDGGLGDIRPEPVLTVTLEEQDADPSPSPSQNNSKPKMAVKATKRARKLKVKESLTVRPAPPEGAPEQKDEMTPESESTVPSQPKLQSRPPRNQLAIEILDNLQKFPGSILLTRIGQFYESYFDQARDVASLLSIKLTKRTWGGQRIWMCGFPIMHLDKYLKTLVQVHRRSVSLCEEFPKPRTTAPDGTLSKPTFDRRVVRVLTPGTLIDESFLNPYENNYLLAISSDSDNIGLAWIDVSTGEFFSRETTTSSLRDYLARISPKEVVLDTSLHNATDHAVHAALSEDKVTVSYAAPATDSPLTSVESREGPEDDVLSPLCTFGQTTSAYGELESVAISLLTAFLQANLLEHMPRSMILNRENAEKRMQIDAQTLKSLEIREGLREGGVTGSLMSTVKRTVTTSGTRLLARWLCAPSTSLDEINARLALVEFFVQRSALRDDIIEQLKALEDCVRVLQRLLLGRGDVSDLLSVKSAINIWSSVKSRIEMEKRMEEKELGTVAAESWSSIDTLMRRLTILDGLARRIDLAVEDKEAREIPASVGDEEDVDLGDTTFDAKANPTSAGQPKWSIKPEFSSELMVLHRRLEALQHKKVQLEYEFQTRYDAPSLTLRTSPGQGMHVHIFKPRRDSCKLDSSPDFVRISESGSTKVYFNRDWFSLGNSIFEAALAINAAEREAFTSLRSEVNAESNAIRRNARVFDELDVTSSFACLAAEMDFVKPIVKDDKSFHIVNGRHPTVELGLLDRGRNFTSNTLSLTESNFLQIITGPNMAGKSTFLRQAAVIAILAQAGSFVPASYAEIGLVDRVFSRVGAKDDLFRDRSTFMVEMLETADILNRATPRSLVVMDEIGRGTTVTDGLAIAFATLHHLYFVNSCRALFATHFHEVVDMLGYSDELKQSVTFPGLSFFCTEVHESEDGRFAYSHRMKPGVNRDSHGLKVAELGGMPPLALKVAAEARQWIVDQSQHWMSDRNQLRDFGRGLAASHKDGRQLE